MAPNSLQITIVYSLVNLECSLSTCCKQVKFRPNRN